MPTEDARHRAKCFDESLKLTVPLVDLFSTATIGEVFIVPITQQQLGVQRDDGRSSVLVADGLHLLGQAALPFTRAED